MRDAEFNFTVEPGEAGTRLDAYLAERLSGASRAQVQRAIESGEITVNDRATKSGYKVRAGDAIAGELLPAEPLEATPEPIPLDILYEDDELIVINKPAGMVVHPGAGVSSGTLANALVYHLNHAREAEGTAPGAKPVPGDPQRPGIVHRLDAGTSGLIVAAKTERAHQDLAEQFAAREVEKRYQALVYGRVANDEGRIDAPIARDPHHRVKMAVRAQGRTALTTYRVQSRFADFTLLDIGLMTGRTHQIRVHLAYIRHPIVGDTTYDGGRGKTLKDARLRAAVGALGRPFLHAARLAFRHPVGGERLEFSADLPAELAEFLQLVAGG